MAAQKRKAPHREEHPSKEAQQTTAVMANSTKSAANWTLRSTTANANFQATRETSINAVLMTRL
jgi:type IV secretory pathway VirB10-like protein